MITRYPTLLSLQVTHDYYGGVCPDFDILLPPETQRALSAGRLLARERDGVLHVLYDAEEGNTPRVPFAGRALRIALRLNNPAFSNFTALPSAMDDGTLCYRNQPDAPALLDRPVGRRLIGAHFSPAPTRPERPVALTIRDDRGQGIGTETIEADRPGIGFLLDRVPPGPGTLVEDYSGVTHEVPLYLHPELRQIGVFAVVDITIDANFYVSPPAFVVPFTAKQQPLRYFLIASGYSDEDFSKLVVRDRGAGGDGRPEVPFQSVRPEEFDDAERPAAQLAAGGRRLVLFRSAVPVPRRQRGLAKIQLFRNGEALIDNLRQPGPEQADANLLIHIAK